MTTHADFIDQLGGGTVIAAELWPGAPVEQQDRLRERVYKWKKNGVPWRWRSAVARLAKRRGVPLPEDFFDFDPTAVGHPSSRSSGENKKESGRRVKGKLSRPVNKSEPEPAGQRSAA